MVSAGGTREYLDPVRFLGNRSSGRQGYALARTAAARGAEVTLVAANVGLPDPAGVKVVRVETTEELQRRGGRGLRTRRRGRDGRGARRLPAASTESGSKIKKTGDGSAADDRAWPQNPDILAGLAATATPRRSQVVVGFAAETGDDDRHRPRPRPGQAGPQGLRPAGGQRRRRGRRLRQPRTTRPSCSAPTASAVAVPRGSKEALAHVVWDQVAALLDDHSSMTPS